MSLNDNLQATSVGQYAELYELDLRPIEFDFPTTVILNSGSLNAQDASNKYFISGIDWVAEGLSVGDVVTISGFTEASANITLGEVESITTTSTTNDTFILKDQDILANEVGTGITVIKYPGLIYRFTTSKMPDGSDIEWQGSTYSFFPIEAEGFEIKGTGALPTPVVRVSNVTRFFSAISARIGDFVGAKFTRTRTLIEHTDNGTDPDPSAHMPLDIFTVNRMLKHNALLIEWELTSSMDQEGRMIPNRQCFRDTCSYVYRQYNADINDFEYAEHNPCPYVGSSYYKADDTSTVNMNEDVCSHSVDGCYARFGDQDLPFRGFPGLQKTRIT